jgi:hypothetical protein
MSPVHKKIAIIGAGPAGLGAAEALREKGYTDITLFERNNRVGGLSLSCIYDTPDGRQLVYDMGSVQPLSSKILLRLLKKYGLGFGRGPLAKRSRLVIAYSYLRNEEFMNYVRHYFGVPARQVPLLMADMAKLSKYLWRYRRLSKPGFHNFRYWNETTGSFRQWVTERKFNILGEKLVALVYNLMTLSNKNNEEQVQVYAVFKFLYQMLQFPIRYLDGTYRPVKEGFQTLWKQVASQHDVRLDTVISSVVRHDNGVTISAGGTDQHFDALIISCPFDRIAKVVDVRGEEQSAFSNINYNPGYRGAFVARNGPRDGIYWFPDSYETGNEPPYLALAIPEGKIDEHTYLYSCVFSHCPDQKNAVSLLQASAEQTFREQYGSEVIEWVNMKYWADYGCLFDVEQVRAGVFDQVEAMQGKYRTFYAGQLVSFSAHSSVVDYSYDLVKRFF